MRALVIDDSRTQALSLSKTLERNGFDVELAYDGEAGVARCVEHLPDVVVTDVRMPKVDGYEVCRRLRADASTRDVPIMILTQLADPMEVVRALAAGADNFVTKPVDDVVLLARVRHIIDARRDARRQAQARPSVEINETVFPIDAEPSRILDVLVSALEDAGRRNAELETSREVLARAKAEHEDLMAIVAHELKTPLSNLSMRADLALRRAAKRPPTADEFSAQCLSTTKQVARMVTIIDDLVDISRIQSGGLRIQRKRTDLVGLVRDAAERQHGSIVKHELKVTTPDELSADVDPARIEQVITNLVSNAIKYSPNGGTIELCVEAVEGRARVSVADQGIGIAPESMGRLFQRYYRTSEASRTAQGLGLGLYVSKRLVELHGGTIAVTSTPGVGSTFTFTLPLQAESGA
jgi:signal transduction histidine kinase